MRIGLTILTVAVAASMYAAPTYHTSLLEKLAKQAGLSLPEDLGDGVTIDSISTYSGRPVRIRTDAFGDVSHIGFRLFDNSIVEGNETEAMFNFVERYFLELATCRSTAAMVERMLRDKVTLVEGSIDMLRAVNPQTPLSVEYVKRRIYRLTWTIAKRKLCITFPADCQLLLGANAIELEQMLSRDLARTLVLTDDLVQDWSKAKTYREGDWTIVDGGKYLSDLIRGDLYLTGRRNKLRLYCDRRNPQRSVSNIMLTGQAATELPMRLRIDMYGYKADTLQTTVQQFVSFCQREGCQLYFGIKTTAPDRLTGTLFALNEPLGYNHVLAIDFPYSLLDGTGGEVKGTAYCYIPLHNVAERFFNENIHDTKAEQP